MTMTFDELTVEPLAGFVSEAEMAKIRKVTPRTLRAERQRGSGPPFTRDGKKIYYFVPGYREWLAARMTRPVRNRGASAR